MNKTRKDSCSLLATTGFVFHLCVGSGICVIFVLLLLPAVVIVIHFRVTFIWTEKIWVKNSGGRLKAEFWGVELNLSQDLLNCEVLPQDFSHFNTA